MMPPADSEGEMQEKPACCLFCASESPVGTLVCIRAYCRCHIATEPPPPSVPPQRVEPERKCFRCRGTAKQESGEACLRCSGTGIDPSASWVDSVEPPASQPESWRVQIGMAYACANGHEHDTPRDARACKDSQEGPSEGNRIVTEWMRQSRELFKPPAVPITEAVLPTEREILARLIDSALSSKGVRDFKCKARASACDPPQDCNWPMCGCDPYADKVMEALGEAGVLRDGLADSLADHAPECSRRTVRCECGAEVCNCNLLGHVGCGPRPTEQEMDALRAACREAIARLAESEANGVAVRDEALEEAAKTAEATYVYEMFSLDVVGENIGRAIRALKGGKP